MPRNVVDADEATASVVQNLRAVPVAEVMTTPVVVIAAAADAWAAMERFGVAGTRHLVVLDSEGTCTGILTHPHIAALWPSDPLGLREHRVGDLVDSDVALVRTEATVADAALAMLRHGVDAVAVVDRSGRVVGVLTGSDIIRLVAFGRRIGTTTSPADQAD